MSLITRTATLALAAASRENGRKSKGPVTEQGKAVSRANAGKHWSCSLDVRELIYTKPTDDRSGDRREIERDKWVC